MTLRQKPVTEGIAMTEADYLKSELTSEVKREYIDGYVYAMTGAKKNHNFVTMNVARKFGNHLEGTPCATFTGDIKVAVGKDYFYPDVVVDCTNTEDDSYFANAPIIIVEVLSQSTRKLDLTKKLFKYINLPSLKEYVLIEQDSVSITVLRKSNDWKFEYYVLGDTVTFESIGLTLAVEETYDRVNNNDMKEFRQGLVTPD